MYESFYRLSGKPFQLSPDPSFFYESRVHRRAYAYLEYGLYQGEGFIVITGEVGAGKTILVRNLLAHLNADQVVAAHLVSTQLDADELLRAVAASLGLPIKRVDKGSLLAELEQFLRHLAAEGKRALLIVDEAQNLTPRAIEELRMLSNFQLGSHPLLQTLLLGQPEFRSTLQTHPDLEIWWDSSPLVYRAWVAEMLNAAEPERRPVLEEQFARLYDTGTTVSESEVLRAHLEPPTVALNSKDASRLGIGEGEAVEVRWDGRSCRVSARVRESVPPGLAIVPRSLGAGHDGARPAEVRRAG